ncbi:putative cytochrome p450 protein [Diplogelasinospora grovesii]|uniref:Cytochrome p450 protein n=1 Tax=Diplogelasinospora grovesii TaxID=303347 RepID=A0AAN6NK06_9PEZI|nr:putative cytochrome p450 protein [Diplogelasinospora grovesii]
MSKFTVMQDTPENVFALSNMNFEWNVRNQLFLLVGISFIVTIFLDRVLQQRYDKDEPPEIRPGGPFPFVRHMFGLGRYLYDYYVKLSQQYPLPAYSISLFRGKIYVVNAPDVSSTVFRHTNDLSFYQMAVEVITRISESSPEARRIMLENATPEGFKRIHSALAPGPGLERTISLATTKVARVLEELAPGPGERAKPVMLYDAVKHLVVQSTGEAVYGPLSPFRDPLVERAFWDWEKAFTSLMINVLPALTARRGHKARRLMQAAFREYFLKKGHLEGSDLTRTRYEDAQNLGVSLEDHARFEATFTVGIFGTTSPSTFWMVFFIFSRPSLLEKLRAEMAAGALTSAAADDGVLQHTLNLASIRSSQLVTSIWHETLRRSGCGTSARMVENDVLLPKHGLLLKKGNVVQMPSRVLHIDRKLWGEDAESFDHGRWEGSSKTAPQGAFRPFGGGTTLCPGRHFAAVEVKALAVMMCLRFDMTPANTDGTWNEPGMYPTSVAAAIYSPVKDVAVKITRRKGYEEGVWKFS